MNFLLNGSSGKMGQRIQALAKDFGLNCVKGFSTKEKLQKVDGVNLLIDFSHADAFDQVVSFCKEHQLALLSGTTGISDKQQESLRELAKEVPVLWASNTSLGIQFLRGLLSQLGGIKDWDVHIVETHHIHKKDAPSGTAKTLAEDIKKSMDKKEVSISAIRGGGVYGEHQVHLISGEEKIVLEHTALSRDLFVKGALEAAIFLSKQKPGLYQMKDVLDARS